MHAYRSNHTVLATSSALAAILATSIAFGQINQNPIVRASSPGAQQVVQQMASLLRTSRSLVAEVTVQGNVTVQGRKQPATMQYVFALQRPTKMALVQMTNFASPTVVCDGQNLYTFEPSKMQYLQRKAPGPLSAIKLQDLADVGSGLGVIMYWALQNDPHKTIMSDTSIVYYSGLDMSYGVKSHQVQLVQKGWNVDIWVQTDRPLIRKITLTRRINTTLMTPDGRPVQQHPDQDPAGLNDPLAEPEVVMTFGNWKVDEDLPEETFQFVPPQGAKKLADEGEAEYPAYGLKGQPAPLFSLGLLGGGQLSLARLKGRIVVLDFWATWCPPCRQGLPIMAQIAEEYKGKGVVVYAINCKEPPTAVREFVTQTNLRLPVAMDVTGNVAARYLLKVIPQTVVIDPKGIVHAVHVGLANDLKDQMHKTLDTLIAGKDPAKEEVPQAQAAPAGKAAPPRVQKR